MNKVTEMLVRERDGVQSAISRGRFLAPQDGKIRNTPSNAKDILKQMDYLISEASRLEEKDAH